MRIPKFHSHNYPIQRNSLLFWKGDMVGCLTVYFCLSVCSYNGYSYTSQTYRDQSLTSPNYPYNYRPSTICLWSLKRPSISYAVKLTFSIFYLESSTSCRDDYLEIRDGDKFSTSTLIGRFCGTRLPPIIVSRYTYIFVRFVSDSDYYPSTRRFRATFRAFVPCK